MKTVWEQEHIPACHRHYGSMQTQLICLYLAFFWLASPHKTALIRFMMGSLTTGKGNDFEKVFSPHSSSPKIMPSLVWYVNRWLMKYLIAPLRLADHLFLISCKSKCIWKFDFEYKEERLKDYCLVYFQPSKSLFRNRVFLSPCWINSKTKTSANISNVNSHVVNDHFQQ